MLSHSEWFQMVSPRQASLKGFLPLSPWLFSGSALTWQRCCTSARFHRQPFQQPGRAKDPGGWGCDQTRAIHCSLGSVGSAVTHQNPSSGCCCTSEEEPGPGGNLVNGSRLSFRDACGGFCCGARCRNRGKAAPGSGREFPKPQPDSSS